jgi:hypothetical protein
MYCEDVDLCTRLRLLGYRIIQDRSVQVTHDAQGGETGRPPYRRKSRHPSGVGGSGASAARRLHQQREDGPLGEREDGAGRDPEDQGRGR